MASKSSFRAPHSPVKSVNLGEIIYSPTKVKAGPCISKQRKNWLDFTDKEESKMMQNFEFLKKVKEKIKAKQDIANMGRMKMKEARKEGDFKVVVKNGELKQTKYKGRFFPKEKVGDMSLFNLSNQTGTFVI